MYNLYKFNVIKHSKTTLTFDNGRTFKKHSFCIRVKDSVHPNDIPDEIMNEVVLEFNKAGGASFSPKETTTKKPQSRPSTPANRQTSSQPSTSAAQPKSSNQSTTQGNRQTSSQSSNSAAQPRSTSTSVRKPPAKSPKNLPPLKSLTIQEKVRLAEKERQETIKRRAERKTSSAPPVANMEAEARTFIAPGVVYPPTATRPSIPAAPVTSSSQTLEHLETIPEGSNEDSTIEYGQGSAPPTNEGDLPNEDNQPMEQSSSEQGRPAQTNDTPLPSFEATFSGSENEANNPPHLGGASSRDLSNVLESQVEVSDSNLSSAESSIAGSRAKRNRKPPTYLHEVYTHNVEDTQQGSQQQSVTPQPRQCNPQIGILKSPPKNVDNRNLHARDTPLSGLANSAQQSIQPSQVVNNQLIMRPPVQSSAQQSMQPSQVGNSQLIMRPPVPPTMMRVPQGFHIPRQVRPQTPIVNQNVRMPAHAFQPAPRRQWLFTDPNFFGYPVNMSARPVFREDAQMKKAEKKSKKNKKDKKN